MVHGGRRIAERYTICQNSRKGEVFVCCDAMPDPRMKTQAVRKEAYRNTNVTRARDHQDSNSLKSHKQCSK